MRIDAACVVALVFAWGATGCEQKNEQGNASTAGQASSGGADDSGVTADGGAGTLTGPVIREDGGAGTGITDGGAVTEVADGGTRRNVADDGTSGTVPCPRHEDKRCRVLTLEDIGAEVEVLRQESERRWERLGGAARSRIQNWAKLRPARGAHLLKLPAGAPPASHTTEPSPQVVPSPQLSSRPQLSPTTPVLRVPPLQLSVATTAPSSRPPERSPPRHDLPPCPFCRSSSAGTIGTSFDFVGALDHYDSKESPAGYPMHDAALRIKATLISQRYRASVAALPNDRKYTAEVNGKRIADGREVDVRADADSDGLTLKLYYQGDEDDREMKQLLAPIAKEMYDLVITVADALD